MARTALSPDPPDDENMKLSDEERRVLNEKLAEIGLNVSFAEAPAMPEVDSDDATEIVEEREVNVLPPPPPPPPPPVEYRQDKKGRFIPVTPHPSDRALSEYYGSRLGDLVRSAWLTARPNDKQVPDVVILNAIMAYVSSHRGEHMG